MIIYALKAMIEDGEQKPIEVQTTEAHILTDSPVRRPMGTSLRERQEHLVAGFIATSVACLGISALMLFGGHLIYDEIPLLADSLRQSNILDLINHGARTAGLVLGEVMGDISLKMLV